MKKLINYSFIFVMVSTILISCKKEEEVTKIELLTSKTWKLVEFTFKGITVTDLSELARIFISKKFSTDGTCITVDLDGQDSDTWEFSVDQSNIIFDKGETSESTVVIKELKSSSMIWEKTELWEDGKYYTTTVKFKALL